MLVKTYTHINSKKAFAKYSVGFLCFAIFYVVDASATCSTTITNSVTRTSTLTDGGSGVFDVCVTNTSTGVITAPTWNDGVDISGTRTTVLNQGIITGGLHNDGFGNYGTITSLTNSRTISGGAGIDGVGNYGSIGQFNNDGTISGGTGGGGYGIRNGAGFSTTIIDVLTNTGSILGGTGGYGIYNDATRSTISTLNNAQGSAGALTYEGKLPVNYNIIINSVSSYGKLAVTGATGVTTFGIYTGSTAVNGTYTSVLSGLSSSNLAVTSGTYGVGSWSLVNSSGSLWDLILAGFPVTPTGPTATDTQTSLVNTSNPLQNIFTLQNAVLSNSFTYDCPVFDKNNVCVSAGGRYSTVQSNGPNNTSALLIGAYRLSPNYRIGAYADQNLSVNNAGSGISLGNSTPLIGLFGVWNEKLDGTGTEVKVSAAYGQKNTTVTRTVVGTSEAGSGSSNLNSQGAQVIAKYGFGVVKDVIFSPYVGVRYTQNNMGGYTEATSSSVTAPLTYSALNTNATTALAGVGVNYRVVPQAMLFASAGVESDMNTSNGTYSATGVTGLTPINFNPNPVKTRATATLGAYYDIEKNHRVGITGIYRQEPFQSVSTSTVLATYTVGM